MRERRRRLEYTIFRVPEGEGLEEGPGGEVEVEEGGRAEYEEGEAEEGS